MLLVSFLGWWYGQGWGWFIGEIIKRLRLVSETFSVGILLRTLFSPWKQIKTPSSFRNFFQAVLDNLISRIVGATVRIFMLIAALFLSILALAVGIVGAILWPVIPALLVIFPLMSLTGVGF